MLFDSKYCRIIALARNMLLVSITLLLLNSACSQTNGDSFDKVKARINALVSNKQQDSALVLCQELFSIAEKESDRIGEAYRTKISVLKKSGKNADAYQLAEKAIEKFCRPSSNCMDCSLILRSQSDLFLAMENYEMSLDYLDQDCRQDEPIWHLKKAGVLWESGDTLSALKMIEVASDRFNVDSTKVVWNFGIGILYKNMGFLDLAMDSYRKALEHICLLYTSDAADD